MARGTLTKEVKKLSKELLGYEITVRELRMMPYIMYCLLDNCNIDPNKVNSEERAILMKWQKEERLSSPSSNFMVSAEFYDIICQILKIGYCSDCILELSQH